MHMDVAAFVIAVCMGADKSLMAGKVFSGILQTELLLTFSGQSVLGYIFRIKAENIMMGFNLIKGLIFTVLFI